MRSDKPRLKYNLIFNIKLTIRPNMISIASTLLTTLPLLGIVARRKNLFQSLQRNNTLYSLCYVCTLDIVASDQRAKMLKKKVKLFSYLRHVSLSFSRVVFYLQYR